MAVLAWPVFAIWMGMGLVVGLAFLATLAWCTMRLLKDWLIGSQGDVYCPVHRRNYHVEGMPAGFKGTAPFVRLSRCEFFGRGRVRCAQKCVLRDPAPVAGDD